MTVLFYRKTERKTSRTNLILTASNIASSTGYGIATVSRLALSIVLTSINPLVVILLNSPLQTFIIHNTLSPLARLKLLLAWQKSISHVNNQTLSTLHSQLHPTAYTPISSEILI
jgi:hypothetical protein